jgi:hypothetical protein
MPADLGWYPDSVDHITFTLGTTGVPRICLTRTNTNQHLQTLRKLRTLSVLKDFKNLGATLLPSGGRGRKFAARRAKRDDRRTKCGRRARAKGPGQSSYPDQLLSNLTALLRQAASPSRLYPDHKWPEDSSTISAMCLVRQRGQAPLPQ